MDEMDDIFVDTLHMINNIRYFGDKMR